MQIIFFSERGNKSITEEHGESHGLGGQDREYGILRSTKLLDNKPIGASPRRDYVVTRMVLVRIE